MGANCSQKDRGYPGGAPQAVTLPPQSRTVRALATLQTPLPRSPHAPFPPRARPRASEARAGLRDGLRGERRVLRKVRLDRNGDAPARLDGQSF